MSAIPVFTLRDMTGSRKKLTYDEAVHLVNKQIVDDLVAAVMKNNRSDETFKSCDAGKYGQLIVTVNEQL